MTISKLIINDLLKSNIISIFFITFMEYKWLQQNE